MQVKENFDTISLLKKSLYLGFYGKYLWMQKAWWVFPVSIKIHASKIAPKITTDDSINVNHGDALDDKIIQ